MFRFQISWQIRNDKGRHHYFHTSRHVQFIHQNFNFIVACSWHLYPNRLEIDIRMHVTNIQFMFYMYIQILNQSDKIKIAFCHQFRSICRAQWRVVESPSIRGSNYNRSEHAPFSQPIEPDQHYSISTFCRAIQ